ncbi:hypothetical protein BD779DRAFT_1479222 [Infundibulicybe gibba]|nr:hypothetical protein BD779DRAFT_1479222 [Infundibulicybe gibba]
MPRRWQMAILSYCGKCAHHFPPRTQLSFTHSTSPLLLFPQLSSDSFTTPMRAVRQAAPYHHHRQPPTETTVSHRAGRVGITASILGTLEQHVSPSLPSCKLESVFHTTLAETSKRGRNMFRDKQTNTISAERVFTVYLGPQWRCPSCLALAGSPILPIELPLPLLELTTTNRPPTESKITHSRNIIDSANKKILLIQADISRLIEIHKTSISPLKALPPELNTVTDPWITPASPEPPLNLMWICSRCSSPTSTPLGAGGFYPSIGSHFHLVTCHEGSPPVVKRVRVSFTDRFGLLNFCEEAPQLTEIWLKNTLDPVNVRLPWVQLQDCTFHESMTTLYALQRAKNIQTCRLDMTISPWWSLPLPPQPCSSGLNTLVIYWRPEDVRINSLFSLLTLLSLQNLEIRPPRFWAFGLPTLIIYRNWTHFVRIF